METEMQEGRGPVSNFYYKFLSEKVVVFLMMDIKLHMVFQFHWMLEE